MKTPKAVIQITKNLSKNGKLKGKNKKETKALKAAFPFHKLNKKGRLVPTTFIQHGYNICTVTNKKFPARFFSKEEIKDRLDNMEELINQGKFFAVATNAGDGMVDYFCKIAVEFSRFKKNFKKVSKIATKQSSFKDKKKNKHNDVSSSYGSWNVN